MAIAKEDMVFYKTHYDKGNCRTYYHEKHDDKRKKTLYCRYDNESMMYVCSQDGEPSHEIGPTYYILPKTC